jgi:hypothetical protein
LRLVKLLGEYVNELPVSAFLFDPQNPFSWSAGIEPTLPIVVRDLFSSKLNFQQIAR